MAGAVLVGALTAGGGESTIYPFVIGGIAIIASIIGILYVNYTKSKPDTALMGGVLIAAVISAAGFWPERRLWQAPGSIGRASGRWWR